MGEDDCADPGPPPPALGSLAVSLVVAFVGRGGTMLDLMAVVIWPGCW